MTEDDSMTGFLNDNLLNTRSQDLEKQYRLNGAIYICKTEELLREKSFFIEDKVFAYRMNRRSSVDIDDELDFRLAEFFINKI